VEVTTMAGVLIATDLGPASESALAVGRELAVRTGQTSILLHVVDDYPRALAAVGESYAAAAAEAEKSITASVELARSKLEALAQPGEEVLVERGTPSALIRAVVAEWKMDYVVVGTHARSGVARFVLGSVAATVAARAQVPVLLVPPGAKTAFKRFLFCVATDRSSDRAVKVGRDLAGRLDAGVDAVHAGKATAEELVKAAGDLPVQVVPGDAVDAIIEYSEQVGADLLVLGSRRRAGISRMVLGSVAESLCRAAAVPLMVVPPE
jgi:nucleotide-binding universal stress UspA family protein